MPAFPGFSFLTEEFKSVEDMILDRLADIRARGERIAFTPHYDGYWGVVGDLSQEVAATHRDFSKLMGVIRYALDQYHEDFEVTAFTPEPLGKAELQRLLDICERVHPMFAELHRWLMDQGRAIRGHYYRPLHGELKTPRRLTNYFRYRRSRRMRYRIPF